MVRSGEPLTVIGPVIRGSKRDAFATIAGIEVGVAFWGLAAVFGPTALLAASQMAYDILRFAGALILIYLGIKAPRAEFTSSERTSRRTGRTLVLPATV
ncbi:LysE family transporter [Amycolatopsis sp. SID8362]|nr:LysE family transporter [Amycolatopsis sp. SID8362]NED40033.1 LysE family transporter [Amycolatopsis sp. SID8362]